MKGLINMGWGHDRDDYYDHNRSSRYIDDRDYSLDDFLEHFYVFIFCGFLVFAILGMIDNYFGWGITDWLKTVAWPWIVERLNQ